MATSRRFLDQTDLVILLAEHLVDIGKPLGAVEFLRGLVRDSLELQHPGPQVRVVVIKVAQLFQLGVGAEPTAAPVGKLIDRRKESRFFAETPVTPAASFTLPVTPSIN